MPNPGQPTSGQPNPGQPKSGQPNPALRRALKRGRAAEALRHAALAQADVSAIFTLGETLAPNAKALARMARRLAALRGVLRVTQAADGAGLVLFVRNHRTVHTRMQAQDLFSEAALVYTRIALRCERRGIAAHLSRAGFCRHALERLVERSAAAVDAPLLPLVDAEAVALLRARMRGTEITDAGDSFHAALACGVWAGSLDFAAVEPDWRLVSADPRGVPFYSVRTFLGPDQMRPTLWLAWRGHPAGRMAA